MYFKDFILLFLEYTRTYMDAVIFLKIVGKGGVFNSLHFNALDMYGIQYRDIKGYVESLKLYSVWQGGGRVYVCVYNNRLILF